jgi:hypothetical protein
VARNALTAAGDPAGQISAYLAALNRALLPGPPRVRDGIVDEIADGLLAAADRHRGHGAPPAAAVRAALSEFGPPQLVAQAFAGELAVAGARRLLGGLLLTGPLIGVWWLLLLAPRHWPPNPADLVAAIPALPVVGATVALAVASLVGTGRLAHRLPALSPPGAVQATHVAVSACLVFDVVLLGQLVVIAIAGPLELPPVLMAAAATASIARLCWMAHASRACRRSTAVLS